MSPHQLASGIVESEEELSRKVLEDYECAEILVQGEERIGLLKICRKGPSWDLSQIQIVPGFQCRGIGTHLIRELVNEAQVAGATIRLKTLKSNPALQLYRRLGFVASAEKAHSVEMKREPHRSASGAIGVLTDCREQPCNRR